MSEVYPINAIILYYGNNDRSKTSPLIFQTDKFFPNKRAAIHSLVRYLWDKFVLDYYGDSQESYSMATTDFEECCWHDFLENIFTSDREDYGEHFDVPNKGNWSPFSVDFNFSKRTAIIVTKDSEFFLTYFLFKEIDGLIKCEEDIDHLQQYQKEYENIVSDNTQFSSKTEEYVPISAAGLGFESIYYFSERKSVTYKNGALANYENGILSAIRYNTGDIIWYKYDFVAGENRISKIKTHDGVVSYYET